MNYRSCGSALPHWLKLRIELRLDPQGTIGRRAARRDKPAAAAMTDSHRPSTARSRQGLPEFRRVLPPRVPEPVVSRPKVPPLAALPREPEPAVSRAKVPPLEVLPLEPEPLASRPKVLPGQPEASRPKVPPLEALPLESERLASPPKASQLEVLPLEPELPASQREVSPLRPAA